jgi:oligoribonuclease NrnB/cAMP/cGMP phosphodiesterase (DHH superfamily)
MKTYVLYHSGCWDGFCAAWIARAVLEGEVDFIPVQYGQDPPGIEPKSRLYILDFCYPREQLFRWWQPGPGAVDHMIVLDHHVTSRDAVAGFDDECMANGFDYPEIVFDMGKSGARLAWEHFMPGVRQCPGIVDYVEDRDLWRWALPDSQAVNACVRSYPLDFEQWDRFALMDRDDLRREFAPAGEAILRRERQIIDDHKRHAREIDMDGYKILVVNATVLFSDIAGELAEGRPFGACYFDRADGKRQWSLRSRDEGVDVSAIAKAHGGGGHRNAAGFETLE